MKSTSVAFLVLAVCFLCQGALAQVEYSFDGNITAPDPDGSISFRHTIVIMDNARKFAGFRSISADVDVNAGQVDVDTLGGFVSWQSVPFALLAYWDIDASWTVNTFSVDAAQNVIAKALLRLQEKTSDGVVVASYGLGGGEEGALDWGITSRTTGDLKYFNLFTDIQNNNTGSAFRVTVTFFISQISGVVNYGNTEVTPRKVESVLRISGYSYADASNHLTLTLAAATGDSSVQVNGGFVSAGNAGLSQLYVSVASECHVVANDQALVGEVRAVSISSFTAASAAVKAQITASAAASYMTAKFQGNWDVKVVNIDFPANATNIVYDPTIGASEKAVAPTSSGTLLLPSLSLAILFALLAFVF